MQSAVHKINYPERWTRSALLLMRTLRPRFDDLRLPETRKTREGFEYHVYEPGRKPVSTVMMIYGMTLGGIDDARVGNFGRACADAGLRLVVPYLPGLTRFQVVMNDFTRLKKITAELVRDNPEKLGLMGFSTGGNYALLLAGQKNFINKIGSVVLFSPIYDLRVAAENLSRPHITETTENILDQFYWGQYVVAYRNRWRLHLKMPVHEALYLLIENYAEYSLDVKRQFYEDHIAPLKLTERQDLFFEGELLDRMSARGALAPVKSPVFILQDVNDRIVPPEEHALKMHAELALRGPEFRQELLVTPWLSHVFIKNTGNPADLLQIVTYLSELFSNG